MPCPLFQALVPRMVVQGVVQVVLVAQPVAARLPALFARLSWRELPQP